ncbi:group II intron reverse transcriptase/maturase [Legionella sainthelensi]|uniref:group II intron reverse transcriptase/maturase n=1 Tax=Legionella sainthelensi TaxID=28087 RepID=UPI00216637BA|nr:group II intron reverse transcriptase/maturase [Legionella sainthelensi]
MTKGFNISKHQVVKAYKLVKANAGSSGIDRQSLSEFDQNLKSNLYKIWNRLSSGSYFPPPVKAVLISKKSGGTRTLGVPTVSDRIVQMIVKLHFEPYVESYFLEDSYGYRPGKSALDAIGITRRRCWQYDWILEFDIKGLFDNISHDLLMKAVQRHTQDKWIILYIRRWLSASIVMPNGETIKRDKGTPQGGVISPVLSNLFLHYVFDKWMQNNHSETQWCRYADDGLVHCKTEKQAEILLDQLKQRFNQCGLELHPEKTKVIYCKDSNRKGNHSVISFDYLGYTFKPRLVKSRNNKMFVSFTPAVSKVASKAMKDRIRQWRLKYKVELSLEEIAGFCNPTLRGWMHYYGKYSPSSLEPVLDSV